MNAQNLKQLTRRQIQTLAKVGSRALGDVYVLKLAFVIAREYQGERIE